MMRESANDGLVGSRRSISQPFVVPDGHPARDVTNVNTRAFLQRLGHSLPYGRGIDVGFEVEVTPESAGRVLLASIPVVQYPGHSIPEAIRALVEGMTFDLARGVAYFEIDYLREPGQPPTSKPTAFRLHIVPAASIVTRGRRYFQVVQRRDERGAVVTSRVALEPDHIVRVKLARDLKRNLSAALDLLRASEDHTDVVLQFLSGQRGTPGNYSLEAHNLLTNDVLLRETRHLGWDGGGQWMSGLLDPERAWRALQFARAQIRIRDAIIDGLRAAVHRAGGNTGLSVTFELRSVLRLVDIKIMEAALADGSRPLAELAYPRYRPDSATVEKGPTVVDAVSASESGINATEDLA